ncbi:hypothetical protein FOZ61_001335 [Perkinsus olseni]|uniref:Uncharacterized protein n=1 Tax=Perkinsus olseni TaxID=32597 RepID=A0A7J6LYC8_PEROL|nr:hypothetical protein FOZ61_001335 [Perkinsus olseni]
MSAERRCSGQLGSEWEYHQTQWYKRMMRDAKLRNAYQSECFVDLMREYGRKATDAASPGPVSNTLHCDAEDSTEGRQIGPGSSSIESSLLSSSTPHVAEAVNQKNEAMTMLLRDLQEEIRCRDSELAHTRQELAERVEENAKLVAQGESLEAAVEFKSSEVARMRQEIEVLSEQLDFFKKCGVGDEWTLVDYEEAHQSTPPKDDGLDNRLKLTTAYPLTTLSMSALVVADWMVFAQPLSWLESRVPATFTFCFLMKAALTRLS